MTVLLELEYRSFHSVRVFRSRKLPRSVYAGHCGDLQETPNL